MQVVKGRIFAVVVVRALSLGDLYDCSHHCGRDLGRYGFSF